MELKYRLLFLLLLTAGSCLFGLERTSKLPFTEINKLTGIRDVLPTDTIRGIEFATRVDSIYKYVAKVPNSTWEIVFKDGIRKPDLQTGDILKITSDDGTVKYYFLKLNPYLPSTNALLGSITWPDMPTSFKGEMAQSYGWHGDTIPSFDSLTMNYVLVLPKAYEQIPALTYSTCDLNAMVKVRRAVSLEGSEAERTINFTVIAEDSITKNRYTVLLKKEQDTLDIQQKSTVISRFYKVSEGNGLNETIKGVRDNTTVNDFYSMITKASELQALKVISGSTGNELAENDILSMGDTLEVLSADKTHSTKYILELTAEVINTKVILTSSVYTISVTGTTGTISGFPVKTLLKTILANVIIPSGATLTVVDQYDAYKPLVRLNYDTAYVDVQASHDVYFEVIAEDGVNKVLYQLLPDSRSSDAYVTSDLYSVDQVESIIYFLRPGTSVASLLRDMTPAQGAIIEVMDKGGFIRSTGTIYKDDRLVVSSEDRTNRKVYYFKSLDYKLGPYLAYIVSDEYTIDHISHVISSAPVVGASKADFISKLFPVRGATIQVLDHNGNISSRQTLSVGDYVMVTSENGIKKTIYSIDYLYDGVETVDGANSIKIFPNPTAGRLEVRGLANGNRVRIITPSGAVLYDRIAHSSSLIISLDTQPSGVYLFEVSKDHRPVSLQKFVKK
jgi:hypothetical protein